jgi:hypothetical protein
MAASVVRRLATSEYLAGSRSRLLAFELVKPESKILQPTLWA